MSLDRGILEESRDDYPTSLEANFLLYSMYSISRIKNYLLKYPQLDSNKILVNQKGCSATLVWSGE